MSSTCGCGCGRSAHRPTSWRDATAGGIRVVPCGRILNGATMQKNGTLKCVALLVTLVGFAACADKSDGPAGSAGEGTTGTDTASAAAPLDNGPGGGLVMVRACAPNDAPAYSLLIGLGDRCDMEPPDPGAPYVQLVPWAADFMASPVDNQLVWSAGDEVSATFAPEGRNAPSYTVGAGTLYLSEWEGAGSDPAVGGAVSGWYTLTLDDGSEVGAAFSGEWCGGDPICG